MVKKTILHKFKNQIRNFVIKTVLKIFLNYWQVKKVICF